MSDYPMLISNKLHSFRNFTEQIYKHPAIPKGTTGCFLGYDLLSFQTNPSHLSKRLIGSCSFRMSFVFSDEAATSASSVALISREEAPTRNL